MINGLGYFVLLLTIVLPFAWLASEFQSRRWLRVILGATAILLSFGVAFLVGSFVRLNYNAWYGGATKTLIDTTIIELQAGNTANVLSSLKRLQAKYEPTYENRGHYDELVNETTAEMQAGRK